MEAQSELECSKLLTKKFDTYKPIATFEEYPALQTYDGDPVAIKTDNQVASTFFPYISDVMQSGPNFAGDYTLAQWNFSKEGQMVAIADTKNGKVYPFPYVGDVGFEFRKDSNLLIMNPVSKIKEYAKDCASAPNGKPLNSVYTYYFVFEKGKWTFLGPYNRMAPKKDTTGFLVSN